VIPDSIRRTQHTHTHRRTFVYRILLACICAATRGRQLLRLSAWTTILTVLIPTNHPAPHQLVSAPSRARQSEIRPSGAFTKENLPPSFPVPLLANNNTRTQWPWTAQGNVTWSKPPQPPTAGAHFRGRQIVDLVRCRARPHTSRRASSGM